MFTINYYPNTDALQDKVNEYFDYCFCQKERNGRIVYEAVVPPTFSGLARYLGFSTRRQLIDYVNADNLGYEDIINDAKLRIEDFYEQKLILAKGPSTGIQFALKNNCGWEDTSKTQLTDADNKPLVFSWGIDDAEKVALEAAQELTSPTVIDTPKSTEVIRDAEIIEDIENIGDAPVNETDDIVMMGDLEFE